MKLLPVNIRLAIAAGTCLVAITEQKARAFGIGQGWNYVKDSFTDSTLYSQVGGTAFEIYGVAFRQDGDKITVALNANLDIAGWNDANNPYIPQQTSGANAGLRNIGWGDLIFNFSGKATFSEANSSELFGVHFAVGNDSGVTAEGVYENITVASVTTINAGHASFTNYNNYVKNYGGEASLGDLAADTSYFNQGGIIFNSIQSGTKVQNDNFTRLDAGALGALGLNFSQGLGTGSTPLGNQTFGFSFNRAEGMRGNFIAHVLTECGNDGIAAKGNFSDRESVPEPTTILGTAIAGASLIGARMRRRRQTA